MLTFAKPQVSEKTSSRQLDEYLVPLGIADHPLVNCKKGHTVSSWTVAVSEDINEGNALWRSG